MGFIHKTYGFTMLPLILFMFVIVGLLSAGYMMLGPKVQLGKTVETKAGLEKAADAIISWSVANGRLPDTVLPATNPTYFLNIIPSQTDSWGRPFVYLYENTLANQASGGICGRTTTSYPAGCTDETTCNAFILISGGEDQTVNSVPATSQSFPATITLDNRDLTRTVTLAELKNRAGCYGSTQGRLKILNNELPSICDGSSTYNATLVANGGVAGYTWTIQGAPAWLTCNATPSCTGSYTGPTLALSAISAATPPVTLTVTLSDTNNPATTKKLTIRKSNSAACASLPTPTAAWNFNEGTGNTIGSGSTLGTITGTANWVARGGGYTLLLNGTNNYIYFNDINYFNIGTGNMTLSAWVNFSGTPAQHWCDSATGTDMAIGAIAGKGFLYPAIGYGMYVTQTRPCPSCTSCSGAWSNYKVAFQLRNPANSDIHSVYSDSVIAGGSWAHVVAVLDRNASPATDQIKLYINNVKQTDASNDYQYTSPTALNFDNTFKFTIGARHDGGSGYGFPYWGYIDDVQFYKVALTDAQISTLYTTGLNP